MANMSYVRFENTLSDLLDAYENLDDTELSESEKSARTRLIKLCAKIMEEYGDED
ncbi:hypothetical protein UFOVP138_9 [uncultured Caudovirales phage]|uniref:Uncharacterized protein n=1 Tax=uncultured Caudovirales phage TaxID=2100421 RepID=A0A6J5LFG4_9CAUD|nr:hypothetical protein UFOVP138_9 [uncultured Caudovirales phage]